MTDWIVWLVTSVVIVGLFYMVTVPLALALTPVIICVVAVVLSRKPGLPRWMRFPEVWD